MADNNKSNDEEYEDIDRELRLPIDLWLESDRGGEFTSPNFDPDVVEIVLRPKSSPESGRNIEVFFDKNSINKIFRY